MARRTESGFTLIELLIVIGIIALTAGVIGLALRGGNASSALQSAQGTLGSLTSAARSQAALAGSEAALAVSNDPSGHPDRYLCDVAIAVLQGGSWVRVSDYTLLPPGIYVVPETGAPTASGVTFGRAVSTALKDSGTIDGESHLLLRYAATGLPMQGGVGAYLVVATADRQPPGSAKPIQFNNALAVRGLRLTAYGAVSYLNDPTDF